MSTVEVSFNIDCVMWQVRLRTGDLLSLVLCTRQTSPIIPCSDHSQSVQNLLACKIYAVHILCTVWCALIPFHFLYFFLHLFLFFIFFISFFIFFHFFFLFYIFFISFFSYLFFSFSLSFFYYFQIIIKVF